MKLRIVWALCLLASTYAGASDVRQLDWESLLPREEREHYSPAPPPPVHDYLGEGSLAALQTGSAEVNRELDGLQVRVPGFVVPLSARQTACSSEFFSSRISARASTCLRHRPTRSSTCA